MAEGFHNTRAYCITGKRTDENGKRKARKMADYWIDELRSELSYREIK